MDKTQQRTETTVEVRELRPESEEKSCFECRNVTGNGGWPWCRFFDKPTSGAVNDCSEYKRWD